MGLRAIGPLAAGALAVAAVGVYLSTTSTGAALLAGLIAGAFTAFAAWFGSAPDRDDARALRSAVRAALHDEPVKGEDSTALGRRLEAAGETFRHAAAELSMLRAVIDGMVEGVWITDASGTIYQHNTALKEMLFAGRELVGQRPVELLRSPELQQAVEQACRQGVSAEVELQVEGLRPRTVAIRISPLGHELKGSAAVFVDVTELRRLEKVRKDFVANVSHELRTPITAILGYSETLRKGALSDHANAPRMVEIIHRQSERLSELVEDLLELSRIESKELQLAQVEVDLADCAQRAADALRPKAQQRGTTIELQVPPRLFALADPRAVEQVLLNLLDNAVKYTKRSGRVSVLAKRVGPRVEIAVRDDGQGIEPKHLPRIFERFYRVDKGRSRDMGGTGLGLSIVKHLVTTMGGEVRVESQSGVGSTFFVELPVPTAQQPETTAAGADPQPRPE